jgi:hypothetical protein
MLRINAKAYKKKPGRNIFANKGTRTSGTTRRLKVSHERANCKVEGGEPIKWQQTLRLYRIWCCHSVVMKSSIFWDIMPCSPFKSIDVSEEHDASIFRVVIENEHQELSWVLHSWFLNIIILGRQDYSTQDTVRMNLFLVLGKHFKVQW